MVYVGKQKGFHTRTQEEIHELLCHFAMEGSSVLRLKGGDPFVFGRGGEEVQYLHQRNITTHVIPGQCACCPLQMCLVACYPCCCLLARIPRQPNEMCDTSCLICTHLGRLMHHSGRGQQVSCPHAF